ncbi:MAG: ABC transporter ATP-binding protein/permease [Gammaproteobacteria bacterium]|nr:ABC transporter ATP-binding protein/permease [Gammaproteobacteria bacterium]
MNIPDHRATFGKIWALVKPFWVSDERFAARGLLAAVAGLNLALVYLAVLINKWNNDFYNALDAKNYDDFKAQIARFAVLAFTHIVIAVYAVYLRQMLQIRWRRWLTEVFIADWLHARTYYRLELTTNGTDNPDQRIQEDLNVFTQMTLALGLDFMRSVVTLVSFAGILWTLSGALELSLGGTEFAVPGYMMWVAIVYSAAGTWLTHKIGLPLVGLNFQQQRYEADMRYGLVRLRENAEGVALYHGEQDEHRNLSTRFGHVVGNWWSLMTYGKRLNWFTNFYGQIAIIFPYVVSAPRYFGGEMKLGGLMQTGSAFGRVQDALSWFVGAYADLAQWKATVDRLTSFHEAIQNAHRAASGEALSVQPAAANTVTARDIQVGLPDGRILIGHTTTALEPGVHTLLTGPSGTGKSTLFRALAGIWPFGRGRVEVPAGAKLMFLPQKPYLPLGTLRQIVSYPAGASGFGDREIESALELCGLGEFKDRLDLDQPWAQRMSPGEQQRLAFARVLLNQPDWLFLDEATSALDADMEHRLYALVRERLPQTTLVSIAHRPSVAAFHRRKLHLQPGEGPARLVAEPA